MKLPWSKKETENKKIKTIKKIEKKKANMANEFPYVILSTCFPTHCLYSSGDSTCYILPTDLDDIETLIGELKQIADANIGGNKFKPLGIVYKNMGKKEK